MLSVIHMDLSEPGNLMVSKNNRKDTFSQSRL
jgi:hypothetical protein